MYKTRISSNEFIEWNKHAIYNSNIVLINLNYVGNSTLYEIGIIDAINAFGNKHIFIVGVGEQNAELPQNITSAIFHIESTYEDVIDYIQNFSQFN